MTDIEVYDRGVFGYLSTIISSKRIVYAPTSLAIKTITARNEFRDNIPLNFISYYRDPNFDIDASRYNFPSTYRGSVTARRLYEEEQKRLIEQNIVQELPVNLTYQVDIWASRASEVQEIALALIQKIYMQEQVLTVELDKGEGFDNRRFHFTDVSWYDNSDLEVESERGKLYRHTITFTIDSRIALQSNPTKRTFCDGDCKIPIEIYE